MALRPYQVSQPWLLAEPDEQVDYFSVVQDYARPRFAALAKRAITRMQRFQASGVFDDEASGLRSLWDEYCWYLEYHGSDTALLSSAMDDTIHDFIGGVIHELSQPEGILLTCAAAEEQALMPAFDPSILHDVILSVVEKAARFRDMARFEPDW